MARVNPIFRSPLINNPIRSGRAAYVPPLKRKVVSIPVTFAGSETSIAKKIDHSVAAIKIQRVFRGFLVRKNARIVRAIEAEVDEIEKRLGADRGMDLIAGDAKERLKINETLMRLLFRLDSVRGVRDYRKRVIQRVILIQEMLDSMSVVKSGVGNRLEGGLEDETLEAAQSGKPDPEMADLNSAIGSDDQNLAICDPMAELKVDAQIGAAETLGNEKPDLEMVDSTSIVGQDLENGELKGNFKVNPEIGEAKAFETKADQEMVDLAVIADSINQNLGTGYHDLDRIESKVDGAIKIADALENKPEQGMPDSLSTVESAYQALELTDSTEVPQDLKAEVQNAEMETTEYSNQALKAEDLKPENEDQNLPGWELLETDDANDLSPMNQESVIVEDGGEENNKMATKESENEKLKEVMERMVAENEKLKGLLAELCQRSAQQCKLMGGLAERVEHLEKVVQKMEKKNKKKRKESGSVPTWTVDKKGGHRKS